MRTFEGHDPLQASSFIYPPGWAIIEANNAAEAGDGDDGNPANTINQSAIYLDIPPVIVMHLGCGSFEFSTTDNSSSTYWGEQLLNSKKFLCKI